MTHTRDRRSGEFELIDWIREQVRTTASSEKVKLGIGDDCAILASSGGRDLLLTTDMLMDGRHFRTDEHDLQTIGYKAMAVNLSDIAAMAGVPVAALVSVALPRHRDQSAGDVARRLVQGLQDAATEFDVALVGGDTNAWGGPLVVSIAVLGETTGRGAVLRSGARPGDAILVTGALGGSLMGRHLRPRPRLREAIMLHEALDLHAMVDISDGLAADLGHILQQSGGLGAILDAGDIPIHADAREQSLRDSSSPLEHALHDGEDFELCCTVDPRRWEQGRESLLQKLAMTRIGTVTQEPGVRLRLVDGRIESIHPRGFDHLRD